MRIPLLDKFLEGRLKKLAQRSADSSINGWGDIIQKNKSKSGASVNSETALAMGTVFACIRRISTTIAYLPAGVYEKKDGVISGVSGTPASQLIKSPTQGITAYQWRENIITSSNIHGAGYALIKRNPQTNEPLELPLLKHEDVKEFKVDGQRVFKVKGIEDVVFAEDMIVVSAFMGRSPISIHRETIGFGIASMEFGSSFYGNGAYMSGYWATNTAFQSDDKKKDTEEKLNARFQAHGIVMPPLVGGGIEWKSLSLPQKDAQYVESRKFNQVEICQIFDVPPSLVGIESAVTYNNLEQENIRYTQYTLNPRIVQLEQELGSKLLTKDQQKTMYIKFNTKALLRSDVKTQTEHYREMLTHGVYSTNEVRALEDMNKIEGGDIHTKQVNQIPLSNLQEYGDKLSKTDGQG